MQRKTLKRRDRQMYINQTLQKELELIGEDKFRKKYTDNGHFFYGIEILELKDGKVEIINMDMIELIMLDVISQKAGIEVVVNQKGYIFEKTDGKQMGLYTKPSKINQMKADLRDIYFEKGHSDMAICKLLKLSDTDVMESRLLLDVLGVSLEYYRKIRKPLTFDKTSCLIKELLSLEK